MTNLTTKFGNPAPSTQHTSYMELDGVPGEAFTSYGTFVAFRGADGSVTLGAAWNYSGTTSKYRSQFLGETTAETHDKLKRGEYKLAADGK